MLINGKFYSKQDLFNYVKLATPQYEHKQKFHYNNSGYMLLGLIIEKVSDKEYEDTILEHIFNKISVENVLFTSRMKQDDVHVQLFLSFPDKVNLAPYSFGSVAEGGILLSLNNYKNGGIP